MRFLAIVSAGFGAVLIGLGLGAVPTLNEYLHWNIWFIVPVSGLIFGGAIGWLQFRGAHMAGAPVSTVAAVALALSTTLGYLATDVSVYWTTTFELGSESGATSATMRMRDMVTFSDYMRMRLSGSEINLRPGRSDSSVELGSAAAKASFGFDLLGAWLAALFTITVLVRSTPYCKRCDRYKRLTSKLEIPLDPDIANEKVGELQELTDDYAAAVAYLNELEKLHCESSGLKVQVDERVCEVCNEATLNWQLLQLRGTDWEHLAADTLSSSSGETVRLQPAR